MLRQTNMEAPNGSCEGSGCEKGVRGAAHWTRRKSARTLQCQLIKQHNGLVCGVQGLRLKQLNLLVQDVQVSRLHATQTQHLSFKMSSLSPAYADSKSSYDGTVIPSFPTRIPRSTLQLCSHPHAKKRLSSTMWISPSKVPHIHPRPTDPFQCTTRNPQP